MQTPRAKWQILAVDNNKTELFTHIACRYSFLFQNLYTKVVSTRIEKVVSNHLIGNQNVISYSKEEMNNLIMFNQHCTKNEVFH